MHTSRRSRRNNYSNSSTHCEGNDSGMPCTQQNGNLMAAKSKQKSHVNEIGDGCRYRPVPVLAFRHDIDPVLDRVEFGFLALAADGLRLRRKFYQRRLAPRHLRR